MIESSTIAATRAAVQERQTTAVRLAEQFYDKIDAGDGDLHSYLTQSRHRAMAQATQMDALVDKGEALPPLGGVPIAIKDVLNTKGVRTTAGSKILEHYVAAYDCTAVARLEAAGAVVLGKLNCDEFAMGSSNENSAYGPVRNPHDLSRVPGGSSGGSAAAVAAGLFPACTGSDGGGSIRIPSSVCGLFGIKPSRGRVSAGPLVPDLDGLGINGPIARTVADPSGWTSMAPNSPPPPGLVTST